MWSQGLPDHEINIRGLEMGVGERKLIVTEGLIASEDFGVQ